MLLSKFLLSFRDAETKELYATDNNRFYQRVTIFLLILIIVVAGISEGISRTNEDPMFRNPALVSIVNAAVLIIFTFLCFVVRKGTWAQLLLCPFLTIYSHLLFCQWKGLAEDGVGVLWARTSIGTVATFLILVVFNEAWLVNLAVYIPCLAYSMHGAIESVNESEVDFAWFGLLGVFHLFAYGVVGYHCERLSKLAFLGRETSEKSFTRWLRIFDTFPEGMAILKDDGSIMYSNQSLTRLLEYENGQQGGDKDSKNYSKVGVKDDPSG